MMIAMLLGPVALVVSIGATLLLLVRTFGGTRPGEEHQGRSKLAFAGWLFLAWTPVMAWILFFTFMVRGVLGMKGIEP